MRKLLMLKLSFEIIKMKIKLICYLLLEIKGFLLFLNFFNTFFYGKIISLSKRRLKFKYITNCTVWELAQP